MQLHTDDTDGIIDDVDVDDDDDDIKMSVPVTR